MIYVSTSSIKKLELKDRVRRLINFGITSIELSGGTDYYPELEKDLQGIKKNRDLNFLLHNYFPPPKEHFTFNLSTGDEKVFQKSVDLAKRAIELSLKLVGKKYAFHAGFRLDAGFRELGKKFQAKSLIPKEKAIDNFCEGFSIIKEFASDDIELYVENNVYSYDNYQVFGSENPFLLTDFSGYSELRERIEFQPLLDVGHLKVSCLTLELDFENELKKFFDETDYIHLSDNDGKNDLNEGICENSFMYGFLKKNGIDDKTITLEINDYGSQLKDSYNLIKKLKK